MTFLEAIERYDLLGVHGIMRQHELEWLFDTAAGMHDGAEIVELGTLHGRSACAILAGIASAGVDAKFSSMDRRDVSGAAEAIAKRGLPIAELICGECRSDRVLDRFADGSVDWLFVDADHERTQEQLDAWAPKLKDGGLMSGHDITHPDVRAAVEGRYGHWTEHAGSLWTIAPSGDA